MIERAVDFYTGDRRIRYTFYGTLCVINVFFALTLNLFLNKPEHLVFWFCAGTVVVGYVCRLFAWVVFPELKGHTDIASEEQEPLRPLCPVERRAPPKDFGAGEGAGRSETLRTSDAEPSLQLRRGAHLKDTQGNTETVLMLDSRAPFLAFNFRDVLFRRWRWIVRVPLVTLFIVMATVGRRKPVYEATAILEVRYEHAGELNQTRVADAPSLASINYVQTKAQLLLSRKLCENVVDELQLYRDPEFYRRRILGGLVTINPPGAQGAANAPLNRSSDLYQNAVQNFTKSLRVKVVPSSYIIEVSFDSADPAIAARAANSLSEAYTQQEAATIRDDYNTMKQATEVIFARFLEEQLAKAGPAGALAVRQHLMERYEDLVQTMWVSLIHPTSVRLADPAEVPAHTLTPGIPSILFAGLLVGLLMGVTLAFAAEAVDSSVRSAEEVERLIKLPALAVIPDGVYPYRQRRVSAKALTDRIEPVVAGRAVLMMPASALAESFRSLRTAVLLSTAPRPPRTLLVTSPLSGEGKTTTATNLAISFAQRGGPVLIIDADLRRPSVAKTLQISNEKGLSGFLTGAYSLDEALVPFDYSPDLWILPAGPRPPDPAELLSSQLMEATLKDLMRRFTQIVVDAPPLLLAPDAVILSAMVDGTILVAASGETPRGALVRAYRTLQNAGARTLGFALNKVDLRFDTYYGTHFHSYYGEAPGWDESRELGGAHPRSRDWAHR